jgi:hypothetical protein
MRRLLQKVIQSKHTVSVVLVLLLLYISGENLTITTAYKQEICEIVECSRTLGR